ncbi:NTP transf 2 domain-containing protein [Citrus sinensis]|nr:NTP transf 2 domain-containing protein [Citrus sinensis]
MGEHEGRREPPSGLLLNGLLPNEAGSVIRALDPERWLKAEERTAELIACIQPNPFSEERRNAVADYVQRLISKCVPCQVANFYIYVFTFGSVPLKTYLPDGDIDLTAFSDNQTLKDTWAHQVRDMLENEEKNEHAEFRVKEVQYIQAEVKIIKCLVENIVVDISFNQLGGLCTLCFLEEVDHMINQNHLFKRSIILIKAWCYYESRILGAHHGLISTYALETLVLYIFHVFNNSFAGPLEVLYRFLEFFSKFDWDNFCLSLWGPVPISSLPDVTAEPPRKDGGVLLLSKLFLDACSSTYAVFPGGQENQGQPFVSKHFNVIDPLRVNNNLGRSVSKGNFFRIRSAFAFGAKRLARLLDCPNEDLYYEVNQFFMNTWDRHGSGVRPDAPRNDLWRLRLSNRDHQHEPENLHNNSGLGGKRNEISIGCESQVDRSHGSASSQHINSPVESTFRVSSVSTVSHTQTQKNYGNLNSTRAFDQGRRDASINQNANNDKGNRSFKPDIMIGDIKGRYLFARTRSSPELTDTYGEVTSQGRPKKPPESVKCQMSSSKLENSRRKNLESDILASHDIRSSTGNPSSVSHTASCQSFDATADSNSVFNSYGDDLVLGAMSEEFSSVAGTQGMQQEEQDLVNLMASSMAHGFNGQVRIPLNLASGHLPLPLPHSILTSMGYSQRNLGGMVPTNLPFIETASGANMQFPQSLVSSPLTHFFPGVGLTSSPEDSLERGNENFGPVETNPMEGDNDYWHQQNRGSGGGFDLENGNFEMLQSDDKQQSTSAGYNLLPSSQIGASGSARRAPHKFNKDAGESMREDHEDSFHYLDSRGNEVYFDDRSASSRSMPASHTSSVRSKTNSESSWEGSSAKVSKPAKEKRGRKMASTASPVYGKGSSVSEHSSVQADEDNKEWNLLPTMGSEIPDRSVGLQSLAPLHIPRHQMPGSEEAQTSGSESVIPIAPVLLGHGARQRSADNSEVVPLTFYPTGPPVPFFTMLPIYNFPTESGTSDASTSHFSGEEGLGSSDSGQKFDLSEGLDQSEASSTSSSMRRSARVEPLEHKSDILNSDFLSHWQNLQYGRFCQNPRLSSPLIYPSPMMVPPVYLQGRFPWDGPGRPLSANMNLFTQLISYGPHLAPVTPLQSASNRPAGVYQRYIDEMPRYRAGTGTYLPNPVSPKDRHSTSSRRGNYSHDRSDHHGEREGNWNVNSKSRASGRHNRNQVEKSSSRPDRLAASENRSERPWSSQRHDTFPPYHSQNGPLRSSSTHSGSPNVAYGMYPLSAMNPSGASSNGPAIPPVVMFYPYDHNAAYASPTEQLEFGSLGPVGFSGVNEASQLSEGSRSSGTVEDQRYHGTLGQQSSPDHPSSHVQR